MISVFTPTYQRRKLVENLKISLDNQTDFDFEWIVVDDGSSDGTEEYFRTIKSEKYPIKYFKQNNSGKHIAHNKAATEAKGDLFICVDSDDELFPNAIHTINEINYKYRNIQDCIGYVFPRTSDSFNDKNVWNIVDGSKLGIIDTKEIYGIIETAIVLKLDFVKRHLFPQFENQSGGGTRSFCLRAFYIISLLKMENFMPLTMRYIRAIITMMASPKICTVRGLIIVMG